MKYRGAHTIPSSVALWLEQQLQERGIDSGVYARYVLNFLRDDSVDLSDLPHIHQRGTKKRTRFNSCNLEELKKNALFGRLSLASDQAIEIESLIDELCVKLKEAENEKDSCLKEKTNFEDFFDLELSEECVNVALSYYSTFPALTKEAASSSWSPRNFTARGCCGRGWTCGLSGGVIGSPKVTLAKRKENKENVCVGGGLPRGRMRSRSTVKPPSGGFSGFGGGPSHRGSRQIAKSLDRKDDEVVRYVRQEIKGRKTMSSLGEERDAKMSRTPGRKEKTIVDVLPSDFDRDLPMDFQQLLQSPADDTSFYRQPRLQINPIPLQPNFIQWGTNITSSIWSKTSEKMDDDEVPLVWETTKWSDARGSILSSAWKQPCSYQDDQANKPFCDAANPTPSQLRGVGGYREKKPVEVVKDVQQEEDLLTSMKTHFRPIKDDEASLIGYQDGSSFDIANSFEQIKYRRSESGALYLADDSKYFEFNRSGSSEGFVPKFKVRQSEKFCQTDDTPLVSDGESQVGVDDEEDWLSDEMKYWGSCERLDDDDNDDGVGNEEGSDVAEPSSTAIKLSGWVTSWPCSAIWSNNMDDSNAKSSSWHLGSGRDNFETDGGRNEHYMKLRDELFEEGEELLSDLSIHLLLDADRLDDAKPLAQVSAQLSN